MSMPTSGMSFMGYKGNGGGSIIQQGGGSVRFFNPNQVEYNASAQQLNDLQMLPSQRMRIQGNVSPMQLRAQLIAEMKARQEMEGVLGQAQGEDNSTEINYNMGRR
jgi:hypothetical protein